jgi:hypothetical protein
MDTIITYNEVAALIGNPPSIAPCPNFMNLCILLCHLECALQHMSCPQSNIYGWAGLITAYPMYALMMTTPFRVPNDPGPLVIYYPSPIEILDTDERQYSMPQINPCFLSPPQLVWCKPGWDKNDLNVTFQRLSLIQSWALDTVTTNTNPMRQPLHHMLFLILTPPNKLYAHLSEALLFRVICNTLIENRGLSINPWPFPTVLMMKTH